MSTSTKDKRLAHLRRIAKLGGAAVAKKHGSEHMREIGKKGGKKTAALLLEDEPMAATP